MTSGIATERGTSPRTAAIAKAPNPTCDKPSLSIELRLKTSGTPTKAALIASMMPAMRARCMNRCENASKKLFMMNLSYEFFGSAVEILRFVERQNLIPDKIVVI